jgi:hypothetical protein
MQAAAATETSFYDQVSFKEVGTLILFIFVLKFIGAPLNTSQIVILLLIAKLGVLNKNHLVLPFDRDLFATIFPFSLYAVFIGITTMVDQGRNIANLANTLIILFQIIIGGYLMVYFYLRSITINQFLYTFYIICVIQGFFILLNFIIPPYRDLLYLILPPGGNIKEDSTASFFRVRGLFQTTGATVSAFLSISLLAAAYLYATCKMSKKDRKIIILGLPLIAIGLLFTGRTGLLMIPFSIFFYYMLLMLNGKLTFKRVLPLIVSPFAMVLVYLVLKQVYLYITNGGIRLPDGGEILAKWEGWAFGEFFDFFEGKASNVRTLDRLSSFWFIPTDDATLVFGDPKTFGVVRSDIGYIRTLFSSGAIGGLLYYVGFISIYLTPILRSRKLEQKLFFLFLLIWVLIVECKESFFNQYYFLAFIMLIIFLVQKENQQDIKAEITAT